MLEENATSRSQGGSARTSHRAATSQWYRGHRPCAPETGPDRPSPGLVRRPPACRLQKALPEPVQYWGRLSPCPAGRYGALSCPPSHEAARAASPRLQPSPSPAITSAIRFPRLPGPLLPTARWRWAIRRRPAPPGRKRSAPSRTSARTRAAPSLGSCRPASSPPARPAGAAAPPESARCQTA